MAHESVQTIAHTWKRGGGAQVFWIAETYGTLAPELMAKALVNGERTFSVAALYHDLMYIATDSRVCAHQAGIIRKYG